MNGKNTEAADGKKPRAWAWQDIVIAIIAVACILFSTVIVARGVDSASNPSQRRAAGTRAMMHPSVNPAVFAPIQHKGQ